MAQQPGCACQLLPTVGLMHRAATKIETLVIHETLSGTAFGHVDEGAFATLKGFLKEPQTGKLALAWCAAETLRDGFLDGSLLRDCCTAMMTLREKDCAALMKRK